MQRFETRPGILLVLAVHGMTLSLPHIQMEGRGESSPYSKWRGIDVTTTQELRGYPTTRRLALHLIDLSQSLTVGGGPVHACSARLGRYGCQDGVPATCPS